MDHSIDRLKQKISLKIGFNIKTASDIKNLELILKAESGGMISYNTLRRIYGFLPGTTPQNKSLNTLSRFIGYNSFNDFMKYVAKDIVWSNWMSINSIENKSKIDKTDILFLMTLLKDENYVVYLSSVLKVFVRKQQTASLGLLLGSVKLFPDAIKEESFTLKLATSIGLVLRTLSEKEYKKLDFLLDDNYVFKSHILYFYVDYHCLNGYYGYYLQEILKKVNTTEEKLFVDLMLNYRLFLNNDSSYANLWVPDLEPNLFSILRGRYWGYQFLYFSNNPDPIHTAEFIWKKLLLEANTCRKNYFFMEIIPILIFTKNFDKISYLFQEYYEELFDFTQWNHDRQVSIYLVANSIYEVKKQKYTQAYKTLQLMRFGINDSYEYYFKLFYLLVEYRLAVVRVGTSKTPSQVRKEYVDLVSKTGFKRFSVSFLENYFD